VPGKDLEYSGLDGAFLTHCRLRRRGWRFGFQWLASAAYPNPPGLVPSKIPNLYTNPKT
jgi:hypothetical protein